MVLVAYHVHRSAGLASYVAAYTMTGRTEQGPGGDMRPTLSPPLIETVTRKVRRVMDEEKLLLWVFVASDGKVGELHHSYARTEVEARQQEIGWISEQTMLGRKNIEVKHWPGGFVAGHRAWWAGSIPVSRTETSHATTTRH